MHTDAEQAASKVLASKGSKLHTHDFHLRRGTKGGYIAKHDLADENGQPPQDGQSATAEYPLANEAAMLAHVKEHMGEEAQAPEPNSGPA